MDDHAGLTWAPEGFFEEMRPQWTVEPDIDIITTIARRELRISNESTCSVEFLAKGTFNKVYNIRCNDKGDFIMRISLPVQPRLKTLSEHATIEYLRQHTDLPVPKIFAREPNNNNELGFQWMIMDRIPGTKLCEQWRHMSWLKKELLVRKIIEYQVQLFCKRFHQVGNLYTTASLQVLPTAMIPTAALLGVEHSSNSAHYCLSQIVSIPFFYHENWKLGIARGPYKHTQDWLATRLQIATVDVNNQPVYDDSDEEDSDPESDSDDTDVEMGSETSEVADTIVDGAIAAPTVEAGTAHEEKHMEDIKEGNDSDKSVEDDNSDDDNVETNPHVLVTAEYKHSRIQRLTNLLPKLFPKDEPEEYMLHHQDLSGNNILVGADHSLSGIIDWECVHTVPLWLGYQIPKFLRSPAEEQPPPFRAEFQDDWDEKDHWRRIEEYEKTQLRKFYLDEMERACPEWVEIYKAGAVKADFDFAVDIVMLSATVDFELWLKQIKQNQEPLAFRSRMGQA